MILRWSKSAVLFLSFAFILLVGFESVHADGINGEEARVLAVVKGTFEYRGELYVARQGYLNQFTAELMDRDLTAEQADEAIALIYDNVGFAVEEGYLVKKTGGNPLDKDGDDGNNKGNNDENKNEGRNGGKGGNKDKTDLDKNNNNTSDGQGNEEAKHGDSQIQGDSGFNPVIADGGMEPWDYNAPSVIKETGFHFHQTVYVLAWTALALMACIFIILKEKRGRRRE